MNGAEAFDAIDALLQITADDLMRRAAMFAPERSCLSVIMPLKGEQNDV